MKKLIIALVLLLVVGCQSEPQTLEVTRIVDYEVTVEVPVTKEVTRIVAEEVTREITRVVEVEKLVTATPLPTNTPRLGPTPIPTLPGEDTFAANCVAEQESNEVIARVHRIFFIRMENLTQSFFDAYANIGTNSIGQLYVSIENTTDRTVAIYPDQGTVQIGTELIDLSDYFLYHYLDDLGGDLFPGVVKFGYMTFGINRTLPGEITQVIYRFDAGWRSGEGEVTSDYEMVIELSNHGYDINPGNNELLALCF